MKQVQNYLDTPDSFAATMPTTAVFNLHKITHLALECMTHHPKMASVMAKNRNAIDLVQASSALLDKIKDQIK